MIALFRKLTNRIPTLYFKILLLAIALIVIPLSIMFAYMKSSYEVFIEQEVSGKISRQMEKSGEDLNKALSGMVSLSNIFVADENLKKIYQDLEGDLTYYDRMVIFDKFVANLSIYNFSELRDIKITFFDNDQRMYTNWSVNYGDYSHLLKKNWIQDSIHNSILSWKLFTDTYETRSDSKRYVSLARPVIDGEDSQKVLGVLNISMGNDSFRRILENYLYSPNDSVGIYNVQGEALFSINQGDLLSPGLVREIVSISKNGDNESRVISLNGKKYLISSYQMSQGFIGDMELLTTIHVTDFQQVTDQFSQISMKTNILLLVFIGIIVVMLLLLSYSIVTPVKKLSSNMLKYRPGNRLEVPDTGRRDEIGKLNRSFSDMSHEIDSLFQKLEQEHQIKEQYRYESLRAQLNPHFLFNSLNTIRWMAIIKKADGIVAGIDSLANMLKYSMNKTEELVTLREELDNIRNYIYIQNLRYGSYLEMMIEVEEPLLDCRLIKFILQPIVENAVIHAFKGIPQAKIYIYGYLEGNCLKLYVEDNGNGISEAVVDEFDHQNSEDLYRRRKMTGIGIQNVNQRIKVAYGEKFGIEFDRHAKQGTIVIFTLPAICKGEDKDKKSDDC